MLKIELDMRSDYQDYTAARGIIIDTIQEMVPEGKTIVATLHSHHTDDAVTKECRLDEFTPEVIVPKRGDYIQNWTFDREGIRCIQRYHQCLCRELWTFHEKENKEG